jgi:hypothetical protein
MPHPFLYNFKTLLKAIEHEITIDHNIAINYTYIILTLTNILNQHVVISKKLNPVKQISKNNRPETYQHGLFQDEERETEGTL